MDKDLNNMQTQTKTLPASQVKNNFGAVVNQVYKGIYKEVIVENHGEPLVAIVDVEALGAIREFRNKKKEKEALDLLRQAREEVRGRSRDIKTEKQAVKLANRFGREFVKDLAKEGKLKFERK